MDLVSGITAVTETLKLTKELRQIDEKVAIADLKLRLADVVNGLLEAKEALQDAKAREHELKEEIASLKKQLADRGRFEDEHGRLYEVDEHGKRTGEPYCNLCYVREEKLYRLIYSGPSVHSSAEYWCDNCRIGHLVR